MTDTVDTVELYTDANGRVRWRRLDPGGEYVDRCGKGFDTDAEAEADMLDRLSPRHLPRVVRLGETPPPEDAPPPPPGDIPPSQAAPSGTHTAQEDHGGTEVPTEAPDPAGDEPGP